MKSIIEDIFLGKRGNFNEIKMYEKYLKLTQEEDKMYGKLYAQLTDEQKKLLEAFTDAAGGTHAEAVSVFFKEGFKIGLLIGMEVNE